MSGLGHQSSLQPHPFHLQTEQHALQAWELEVERKPMLFNGTVMLEGDLNFEGNRLIGNSHLVPYSTLLYWLQNEHDCGNHLFAVGLIISADGSLILGKMAEHTFNSGKCYAPSGSLDLDDVKDGKIDLVANIERELGEETGLDLPDADIEDGFHIFRYDSYTIAVKRCIFDKSASQLCSDIKCFIDSDADAELSDVFAINNKGNYDKNTAGYMIPILDWYLDQAKND